MIDIIKQLVISSLWEKLLLDFLILYFFRSVMKREGNRIIGKRAKFAGDDLNDGIYNPGVPQEGFVITTIDAGVCYVAFDRGA